MKGKTSFLALVAIAAMLIVSAVAFAHEGQLPGTKDSDELTMSGGNDRVFARGGDDTVDGGAGDDRIRGGRGDDTLLGGDGDDRLKGGQDSDHLDGGEGDDYINGRGDGRDEDEIVCGDGYDVAVLGRGDVIVEPDGAGDDGCEKVRRPKGRARGTAMSHVPRIRRGATTSRSRIRARRASRRAATTLPSWSPSRTSP